MRFKKKLLDSLLILLLKKRMKTTIIFTYKRNLSQMFPLLFPVHLKILLICIRLIDPIFQLFKFKLFSFYGIVCIFEYAQLYNFFFMCMFIYCKPVCK